MYLAFPVNEQRVQKQYNMSQVMHSYSLFFFFKCSPLVSICLEILCLQFKMHTSVNQGSEPCSRCQKGAHVF